MDYLARLTEYLTSPTSQPGASSQPAQEHPMAGTPPSEIDATTPLEQYTAAQVSAPKTFLTWPRRKDFYCVPSRSVKAEQALYDEGKLPKGLAFSLRNALYHFDFKSFASSSFFKTHVAALDFGWGPVDDESFSLLLDKLPGSSVTHLNLGQCYLHGDKMRGLTQALSQSQVYHLALPACSLEDSDLQYLAEAKLPLYYLDLMRNPITDKGMQSLAEGLKHMSELSYLKLIDVPITEKGMGYLIPGLLKTKIKALILAGSELGSDGLALLSQSMPEMKDLAELNVSYSNVGILGAQRLASVLQKTNLEILNLKGNPIGDEGVSILAKELPDSDLKDLNLSKTKMTREGLEVLLTSLRGSKVKKLDVSGNEVTDFELFDIVLSSAHNGIDINV